MKKNYHNFLALWKERSAVAIIEFAIILPVILLLVYGVVETTRYQQFHQKFEDTTNQLVNLVNQNLNLSLNGIYVLTSATEDLMLPYDGSSAVIFITAVQQNRPTGQTADVLWQVKEGNDNNQIKLKSKIAKSGKGSKIHIPNLVLAERSQIIIVEVYMKYKPIIDVGLFNRFDFAKDYKYKFAMARPRYGSFQFAPR